MLIVNVLMGVLLLCSFLGYAIYANSTLKLKHEFIPVFVFSSIACIVYFCGLLGVLLEGTVTVFVLGIILFAIFIFGIVRKKAVPRIRLSLFALCFLTGSILFFSLLIQCRLIHYDNFSHWAIVLKQMLSTNAFPAASSDLIDFKNYPLGTASFLYYVCRFVGHAQPVMIAAQGLLIFACFYAMFGIISEKKRFMLYAFLAMGCTVLSVFNFTIRINNLLVDFLLPIYLLALLTIVYQYRTDIKKACLAVLPVAGFLTIIKNTGIIFAVLGLIYLTYIVYKHRSAPLWKRLMFYLCALAGTSLPYIAWNLHMAIGFQDVTNKFSVSATNLQSIQMTKTADDIHTIISLFIKSVFDFSSRPTIGIIAFHVAAVILCVFAVVFLKKKWNLWKALIISDAVLVLYYLGILGLYIFSMPLDEAIRLAGFERYASSIVILFAGVLILCATIDIENSFYYTTNEIPSYMAFKDVESKRRYQEIIIVCMAIAISMLLSEYNGILSIQRSYSLTLPYKVSAVTGDRWYSNGQEDNSKYLIYASDTDQQVTNYYLQYLGRYFLYAPNVDGICLFYEDNMDNLLSNYDYLVVTESDADEKRLLEKHYLVQGQEGIYKITKDGDQIALSLVQS